MHYYNTETSQNEDLLEKPDETMFVKPWEIYISDVRTTHILHVASNFKIVALH